MAFTPNLGMILGKFSMASNKWKKIQSHDVNEASFSKRILKPVLSLMSFPVFKHFLMKDEVMNEIFHVRIF